MSDALVEQKTASAFATAFVLRDSDTAIELLDPDVELVAADGAVYGIREANEFIDTRDRYNDKVTYEGGAQKMKEVDWVIHMSVSWLSCHPDELHGPYASGDAYLRLTFRGDRIARVEVEHK